MPFYKGLAKLNSLLCTFLLLWQFAGAPVPLQAKSRKAEKILKDAQAAEARREYDKALELYEQALAIDPADPGYRLGVNRLRFQAAQKHVDDGEKLVRAGQLEEALKLFQKAYALDGASAIAEQRMKQTFELIRKEKERKEGGQPPPDAEERGMNAADRVRRDVEKKLDGLQDAPMLQPIQREIVNLKMNNQPVKILFETLAKMAGVNVMFDPDFITQNSGRNYPVDFTNTTLEEALDYLSILTKAYWKPISKNAIYVTLDNPQKRRDYEDYIVKVFYLQHALEPQELNEIANAVRVVGECRKVVPYPAQMALMVRCTSDQVALVGKIINDMDKARSEVVLDIYVMEANRTRTRSLAATIANGTKGGLNQLISFTPRNPTLTGGSGTTSGTTTGTTGTSTSSGLVALSQLGRISTNDFSVNLPGAFLNAVLDDRSTKVLQNPQVRTVDNKKATLRIGDRYPYATGSFSSGIGGVGAGGGFSAGVQTQFQFAEVGVNVDITPKIHGNEEISLRIEVEVSNIRDQVDIGGLRQPVIGQRKIGEDIRIREGEINLMGGLMSTNNSRTLSGLPWLANLPGLGWLFGSEGTDKSQSELLIAIVPHIVRAPDISDLNLRGVSTGTDQQVKINFVPREVKPVAPVAAPAKPPAPLPGGPSPGGPSPGGPPLSLGTTPQGTPPLPFNPMQAMRAGQNAMNANNKLVLTPQPGQVFLSAPLTVEVKVEAAQDWSKAPLKVDYDKQLLKLISVSSGGMMGADGKLEDLKVELSKGQMDLARPVDAGGISGSGTLLKLTFQTLAKGDAGIRLVDARPENSKQEAVVPAALPEIVVKIE
jgi:general secretion pathway protein D